MLNERRPAVRLHSTFHAHSQLTAVIQSRRRRRSRRRSAAGRRRISRCATPAETTGIQRSLGSLSPFGVLRRFRCFAAPAPTASFNIHHSTLNIQHCLPRSRPTGSSIFRSPPPTPHSPLAFANDLPHTTSRTFRATISVRLLRRAFQRMVFSALIVGFPASLEGRANTSRVVSFL